MTYYIGVDGGGSNLRVVAVDETLRIIAEASHDTANPNVIGHAEAARRIRSCVQQVTQAIPMGDVAGWGIGVAGASVRHSEAWLRDTAQAALPHVPVVPSSDHEIALVGALGKREGILLLAGTGSVVFGVNAAGASVQVGGWGYLLGDEGGGYWIGLQALRAITRAVDSGQTCSLTQPILNALRIPDGQALIPALYRGDEPPTRIIAQLAPQVLRAAEAGDSFAQQIVADAAEALVALVQTARERLVSPRAEIAFAGGLLTSENALSRRVVAQLDLPALPSALYTPVVGAALLAKLTIEATTLDLSATPRRKEQDI